MNVKPAYIYFSESDAASTTTEAENTNQLLTAVIVLAVMLFLVATAFIVTLVILYKMKKSKYHKASQFMSWGYKGVKFHILVFWSRISVNKWNTYIMFYIKFISCKIYASKSIKYSCGWVYKGLKALYFLQ